MKRQWAGMIFVLQSDYSRDADLTYFPTPEIAHLVDPSSVSHGLPSELFLQQLDPALQLRASAYKSNPKLNKINHHNISNHKQKHSKHSIYIVKKSELTFET